MAPGSDQDLPGVRFLAISATASRRGKGGARPAADRLGGCHALGASSPYILFASGIEVEKGAEIRGGGVAPEQGGFSRSGSAPE